MLAQGIETSIPTFAWYLGDKHLELPFMVNRQNLCSFLQLKDWVTQPHLRIKKGLEARVPWVDCVHHSLFYYKTKLRPEALSHYTASSSGWLLLNRTGCPLSKKRNIRLDMDNTKLPNNPPPLGISRKGVGPGLNNPQVTEREDLEQAEVPPEGRGGFDGAADVNWEWVYTLDYSNKMGAELSWLTGLKNAWDREQWGAERGEHSGSEQAEKLRLSCLETWPVPLSSVIHFDLFVSAIGHRKIWETRDLGKTY